MLRRGAAGLRAAGIAACVFAAVLCFASACSAQEQASGDSPEDRWMVEFSGGRGIRAGNDDEQCADFELLGSIEYVFFRRDQLTIGWRTYPVFVFFEDERDDGRGGGTIYGAATGLAFRIYPDGGRRGFFFDIGSTALWSSDELCGNGSRVNFMSEAGAGYAFASGWHFTLKYQHISNAGLDGHNDGFDAALLAVGRSF